jgi:uncharacterized membrane protein
MPFCSNCGSQVDGQFCQKCGTPVGAPAQSAAAPPPPGPYYQPPAQPPPQPPQPPPGPYYQQPAQPPPPPQPPPGQYYQQPSQPPPGAYYQQPGQAPPPVATGAGLTENAASALCYLVGLITGILFLVMEPYSRNKTIRFHAFQSIFFNVVLIAVEIVLMILFRIMLQVLPYGLWFLTGIISLVFWLAVAVLWILLMVKAYQNQKLVLPIIGPLAEKQA